MLSQKNYREICSGTGIHRITETDTQYNTRTEMITPSQKAENVYSVAKLFTVTAVGMCVDRGLLSVSNKFADIMGIEADGKWKGITLHHLLTHSWGAVTPGLLDIDCDDVSSYPTKDYLALVMQAPLLGELGKDYCYTDAAYYLLSLAVEKVCGKTLYEVLHPVLTGVMDFAEYAWTSCPKGHTMGATGLFIRCEDMVKLGVLYLNGGVWKEKRIVSQEWCKAVFQNGYELSKRKNGWYTKGGMYGQMLAVNPEKGLSIAWTAYSDKVNISQLLT